MNDQPIETRPVNRSENLLREKFAESVANQSSEMDKLARQLITLELAIPGLYATVLKLIAGGDGTLTVDRWLYGAFGLLGYRADLHIDQPLSPPLGCGYQNAEI